MMSPGSPKNLPLRAAFVFKNTHMEAQLIRSIILEGQRRPVGQIIEGDEETIDFLCKRGHAKRLEPQEPQDAPQQAEETILLEPPVPEAAVFTPPETAVKPTPKKKTKK